jgi:solute carrier family 25 carnitine/acylcarnitine transporter 20/29
MAVGQPFDTVKVSLRGSHVYMHNTCSSQARLQTDGLLDGKKTYRGAYHCFSHIVKHEGSRALFKGMAAPLLGMAALNSLVFGVHGNLMIIFQARADATPGLKYSFISGCVAGFAQTVIGSTTELIKLRLQFQKDRTELIPRSLHHHHHHHSNSHTETRVYSGPWDAARKIYQREGLLRGIGRGYWLTCLRDVPAFGFYFGTYDYMCRWELRRRGLGHIDELSPAFICVAGGVGGTISWISSYPVDVVKSRYQIDGMGSGTYRYSSGVDCFRQTSREGWRALFAGLSPTLIRAFPVNAVTFVIVAMILREWRRLRSNGS